MMIGSVLIAAAFGIGLKHDRNERNREMIDRGFAEYNQTTGKWQWKEHVTLTNYVTVTNWVSIANFLGVIDFEGTVITNQFQSLTVTNNGAVGIYTPNSGGAE